MLIRGGCHCGNIRFVLDWKPDPLTIPARACTCSFCRKHGGLWTSSATASLRVSVRDPELVNGYLFGTRTAQFHICRGCGIVPVVTSRIDGHLYAVVSVNAFENVVPELLQPAAATFDNETEATRLARRARYWIADVEFS